MAPKLQQLVLAVNWQHSGQQVRCRCCCGFFGLTALHTPCLSGKLYLFEAACRLVHVVCTAAEELPMLHAVELLQDNCLPALLLIPPTAFSIAHILSHPLQAAEW
jgi:hypothetical protein